jgi:hypothetical protein
MFTQVSKLSATCVDPDRGKRFVVTNAIPKLAPSALTSTFNSLGTYDQFCADQRPKPSRAIFCIATAPTFGMYSGGFVSKCSFWDAYVVLGAGSAEICRWPRFSLPGLGSGCLG